MPSSFLGTRYPSKCASEVWKDWGTDQVFPCPEILNYMDKDSKIEFFDVTRLWDNDRGIALNNPVVTSILTSMML
jgi:hypothetical protein